MTLEKFDILYVRRSKENAESLENQINLLRQYAIQNGYYNIKVIKDDGYTGTNFNRPGFQTAMSMIMRKQVRHFIVKDFSRLGRNHMEVNRLIEFTFPHYGVKFISINDNYMSDEPMNFCNRFSNLFNETFSEDISKKQRSSLYARSSIGRHISSVPVFGYKLDPQNRHQWIIDEEPAKTVRRIFDLYIQNLPLQEIAKILNEEEHSLPPQRKKKKSEDSSKPRKWSTAMIQTIIKRREYTGAAVNFKTHKRSYKETKIDRLPEEDHVVIENMQEAIVSREVYEKAYARRKAVQKISSNREPHLLQGKVKCKDCGSPMHPQIRKIDGEEGYVYICSKARHKKECTSHYTPEKTIIEHVRKNLRCLQIMIKEDARGCKSSVIKQIAERNAVESAKIFSRMTAIEERVKVLTAQSKIAWEQRNANTLSEDNYLAVTSGINNELALLSEESGEYEIRLEQMKAEREGVNEFIKKFSLFADVDLDENMKFIVQELIDKVTIKKVNVGTEIAVHFMLGGVLEFCRQGRGI